MKTVGWICALVLLIAAAFAMVFLVSAPRLLDARPAATQTTARAN